LNFDTLRFASFPDGLFRDNMSKNTGLCLDATKGAQSECYEAFEARPTRTIGPGEFAEFAHFEQLSRAPPSFKDTRPGNGLSNFGSK
jgi:hypothetical protein